MNKVQEVINHYVQKTSGLMGVGFKDLARGEEYYVNGDRVFPAASTFKLPLLMALYKEAALNRLDIESLYTLKEEDFATGGGVLALLKPGVSLPLSDYAMLMMIISDNTATDVIYHLLGQEKIDDLIQELDLKETRCDISCDHLVRLTYSVPLELGAPEAIQMFNQGSPFDDGLYANLQGPNDVSSPRDMVKMLSIIYEGKEASKWPYEAMMDILLKCQTNTRIPYYLPNDGKMKAQVAHKTGSLTMVANDSGIVSSNGRDYILSLFCYGYEATEEEKLLYSTEHFFDHLMAEMSRDIFKAFHGL